MPKMKTHRGAAKRFKKTKNGYKVGHSHVRHILTKKTTKRKRHLRGLMQVHANDVKAVKQMIVKELGHGKSKTRGSSPRPS